MKMQKKRMKKILSILLGVCLLLPPFSAGALSRTGGASQNSSAQVWDGSTAGAFSDGKGTSGDPYIIGTPAQLSYLAKQVNAGVDYAGAYFRLIADVDLGSLNWIPIGNYAGRQNVRRFSGNFDGCGRTVYNLCISSKTNGTGLFGFLGLGAQVKNLTLDTGTILSENHYTGAVAGFSEGADIDNCHNRNVSVTGASYTGGILGYAYDRSVEDYIYENRQPQITRCSSSAPVVGSTSVGGIAGVSYNSVVRYCYSTGSVRGSGDFTGGIAGNCFSGSIICCYTAGTLKKGTYSSYTGGICGFKESRPTLENCFYNREACAYGGVNSQDIEGEAEGLTEAELKSAATLRKLNAASQDSFLMDFGSDRNAENGENINNGFPILACQSAASLTFAKWDGSIDTRWYTSEQTEFSIKSPAELAGLAQLVNGGSSMEGCSFYLTNDIDLGLVQNSGDTRSGPKWTPIGKTGAPFRGIFSGCGYQIKNLYLENEPTDALDFPESIGLFGLIENAVLKNFSLSGYCRMAGKGLGSVVGTAQGECSLISVSSACRVELYNPILFTSQSLGGVAGGCDVMDARSVSYSGIIDLHLAWDPYNTSADTPLYMGGIIGRAGAKSNIQNCTNTGDVLVYRNEGSTIHDGGGKFVGGIAGYAAQEIALSKCRNFGKISGSVNVGGIIGSSSDDYPNNRYPCTVMQCQNSGEILACSNSAAGIAGRATGFGSRFEQCVNTGRVACTDSSGFYFGGIAGFTNAAFIESYNAGPIIGGKYSGGIVGSGSSSVDRCYNAGPLTLPDNYDPGSTYTERDALGFAAIAGDIDGPIKNSFQCGSIDLQDCYYYYLPSICDIDAAFVENCYYNGDEFTYNGYNWEGNRDFQTDYVAALDQKTRVSGSYMKSAEFVTALNAGGEAFRFDSTGTKNSGYPYLSWQEEGIDFTFDSSPYADYSGNSYRTLEQLLPSLQNGAQVLLYQSARMKEPVVIPNGQSISFTAKRDATLFAPGDSGLFVVENGGALTLGGEEDSPPLLCLYQPQAENPQPLIQNAGTLTLKDGVRLKQDTASQQTRADAVDNNGSLYISGDIALYDTNDIYLRGSSPITVTKNFSPYSPVFIRTDSTDRQVVVFYSGVKNIPSAFGTKLSGYALYPSGQSLYFGEISLKPTMTLETQYTRSAGAPLIMACSFAKTTFYKSGMYQWYKDDALLYEGTLSLEDFTDGQARLSYEISNVTANDAGEYRLELYDSGVLMSSQAATVTVTGRQSVLIGDADGDGRVSVADVLAIQKHLAGISRLTGERFEAADLKRSGVLSVEIILKIQNHLAGKLKDNPDQIGEVRSYGE